MPREYILRPHEGASELKIDYEGELNAEQFAAVTAGPGPALVIAGAGAGKTRTLTYRVAYLIEKGVRPDRILLLTFTNKAAREMMGRVGQLLGGEISGLWGGTFHGIGARILRRHADRLGFQRDFSIMDRQDSVDLMKALIGALDVDIALSRFPKAELVLAVLSFAKNTQRPIIDVIDERFPHLRPVYEAISTLSQQYTSRKRRANAMDFDDLLALWKRLLDDYVDARQEYQDRFQYILVDEYQDTNCLQGAIIDRLAETSQNVMVVGDDSQGIYSWRGAQFANILEFSQRYPSAKTYLIETNYRSRPEILEYANAVIAANAQKFEKQLRACRPSGQKPALIRCEDGREQAAFVCQRVLELREEGIELQDMAVLYRSHFHAMELQIELTRRKIPFSITSGIRFFEQAHIKDIAAFLKWFANPRDELALKRVALLSPGVGAKTADRVWNAIITAIESQDATTPLELIRLGESLVPKKAKSTWTELVQVFHKLGQPRQTSSLDLLIHDVVDAFYQNYALNTFDNAANRLEDIEQLIQFAAQYEELEDFLAQFALLTNVDSPEKPDDSMSHDEKLRLSTIHQAKGLEFDVVFLISLCDGLFPSGKSLDAPDGEAEERRLFYVATTRAKDELYLTYPVTGSGGPYNSEWRRPSRFLLEAPESLCEEWDLTTV